MKILFRADASRWLGTGHVRRCLTLARELQKMGGQIAFTGWRLGGTFLSELVGNDFPVFELGKRPDGGFTPDAWDQDTDARSVLNLKFKPDWIVVDHYALDKRWETIFKDQGIRLLAIDDLANRAHVSDLLLDQNDSNAMRYQDLVPLKTGLLLGPPYALLSKEFQKQRLSPRFRHSVQRILVLLGGTDPQDITSRVWAWMKDRLPQGIQVDVVIGRYHPARQAFEALNDLRCRVHVETNHVPELMQKSDLCIGAPGTVSWERCAAALPSLLVEIAPNQAPVARRLSEAEAAVTLGPVENVQKRDFLQWFDVLLNSPARLASMSRAAHALLGGDAYKGPRAVVERMQEVFHAAA